MKVLVTVKHTQTATIDIGDLPVRLITDLLTKHEGTFDGNWSIEDAAKDDKWACDEVTVKPVAVKAGK